MSILSGGMVHFSRVHRVVNAFSGPSCYVPRLNKAYALL